MEFPVRYKQGTDDCTTSESGLNFKYEQSTVLFAK